jgi:Arf-GAP/SH3 domain/ANK repeat/PH domain-containing protein
MVTITVTRKEREEFIKAKYVQHKFTIETCSDTIELQQDLQQAIQTRDIQAIIQVYAEGLDLMTVLPESVSIFSVKLLSP